MARKSPREAIKELFRNPALQIGQISDAYQSDGIKPLFQEAGSVGGKARAARMTPAERKAAAARAIHARWAKRRRELGLPPKPGDEEFL